MDTREGTRNAERPVLEPVASAFIDALTAAGGEPIYQLSIQEARQVLEEIQAQPVDKLPAEVEDRSIPGGPSGRVSVRIVRPVKAEGKLPVIMYCHGGGWILGSKNTHDRLVRDFANGTGAAVVFVNYTPSPEAKYPVPIEEAYAATKYFAEHGSEFGLDGSMLAIAGDSVGGNMAAATAILAKQRRGPAIAGQLLFYPVTDANFETDSYKRFEDGPWLTRKAMEWFWDAYAPDHSVRKEITASPLRASKEELHGLPPTLLIVDENDPLRDEGENYARKLIQAGVQVTAVRCLATIHDFMMLNPLAGSAATNVAISLANNFFMEIFGMPSRLRIAA